MKFITPAFIYLFYIRDVKHLYIHNSINSLCYKSNCTKEKWIRFIYMYLLFLQWYIMEGNVNISSYALQQANIISRKLYNTFETLETRIFVKVA